MRVAEIPIFLKKQTVVAPAGATVVQTTGKKSVVASTNATETFTFPGNVTAGNTIILCITTFEGSGTRPVGISLGGTAATEDVVLHSSGNANYYFAIWRATNVAGGTANCVITWDFDHSGSYFTCSAEEWSGFTLTPVDQVPTPTEAVGATSTSITSGVTAQGNEVIYSLAATTQSDGAGIAGPTSSFTQTVNDTGSSNIPITAGYKIVGNTGAYTANYTITFANKFGAVMVTYKTN